MKSDIDITDLVRFCLVYPYIKYMALSPEEILKNDSKVYRALGING